MGLDDFGALLQHDPDSKPVADADRPIVMVIDDDASVLGALQAILTDRYNVLVYASAADAVAAINDEICAVILDVKMKDHDGFWACDEIRKKNSHLPVIFYSAYQDAKDPFDIINQHQPFGYVTKGTSSRLLFDLLERAIRYSKLIMDGRKMIADLQRMQSGMRKLTTKLAS